MASVSALAERYFSTLNPLAEKIQQDVEEARAAYETMWDSLTEKEKVEVINESLIKPELTLKYTALDTLDFDIDDPPFFRKNDPMSFFGREHGRRLVHDEAITYRDEHSAPFVYQTRSQLNLCELSGARNKEEEKTGGMSELALSHSRVVSELRNALRSHDAHKKTESPIREDAASPGGFIAKMMSKKLRAKDDDKERLVSNEPMSQIVTSSDGYFKSVTSPKYEVTSPKYEKEYTRTSVVKSSSAVSEENRGLLSAGSRDSSGGEFQSCEELSSPASPAAPGAAPGAATGALTGYDFLDNW